MSFPSPRRTFGSPATPTLRARIAAALVACLGVSGLGTAVAVAAVPAAAAAAPGVVINEVESNGDAVDWIELVNTSSEPVDISGWVLKDNDDTRTDAVPADTTLGAGEYFVFAEPQMTFGLGKEDAARLFLPDGTTLLDQYSWTQHAATAYGRCPDGTGEFAEVTVTTRGAANDCSVPTPTDPPTGSPDPDPASGLIVVNEVESNGDDTDWFELYNLGDEGIDLTGYIVRDDDDAKAYVLPTGSVIAAGEILLVDQLTAHSPGFDFGLGGADMVRLFAPDGATLIASYGWSVHAATSYGRCPDGTGEMRQTTVTTKGAPNDCTLPVKINEVESSGGVPGDWIELVNLSDQPVEAGGLVVTDSDTATHRYTIAAGTQIAAQGYLVLDEADFGFGLGGTDAVHLFDVDGVTELDQTSWSAHAATTWGRCTDATGVFGATEKATRGAANLCAGEVVVSPWPGASEVRVLDDEDTFSGDLSGLDYADGVLWAVENGNGLLYRLAPSGAQWLPEAGWEAGKKLRYPGGGGTVDAEGVTALGASVYVSSERNNDAGSVSRPTVLKYDPSSSAGELVAVAEWNLSADFPGLAANAGLEGITWVPDSWLTGHGFVDERTGLTYRPSTYPGTGGGLFFVGVEGTASVYAYALMADGSFARVATIATDFALVADVQFDRDLLWVVCDEACDGRTATYEIDEATGAFVASAVYARPSGAANVANEGFAIGSECIDGAAATFYADDADTDGYSLRGGTLDCVTGGGGATPTPTPTPTASPSPTVAPSATPTPSATGSGSPVVPSESALTEENRGVIEAPRTVRPGETIRIVLDPALAGTRVNVWIFSEPVSLGSAVVGADGSISVRVPTDVPPGAHRLVVTDADGNVLAWTEVSVIAGDLAATGGNGSAPALMAGAAVLALLFGAALVRRQRARR